ncbi:hypothetical protein POTOM_017803 [Populus tomentosa]|uniref:DC1 domain-containing protein n=1 Tax=Populus tomentosa TaxID=118781 RepID=A0A8X7ZZP9_POPTO|nr:hypothetical protein POTOM_017803 [Populus tomentosa]
MIGEPEQFQCHACFRNIDGYTYGYKCNECLIYLDVECALLRPVIKEDEDHVLIHFSHLHPLVLVATELEDVNDDPPRCYLCWEFIISSVLFYKCEPCRFYLHKSRAECLDHFYHRCSLALCTERNPYTCNACLRNRGGFHYLCHNCNFRLDVDCALLPEKMKSEGQDQLYHHPMHGHPLTLVDVTDDEAIHCVACQKSCCDKAYVCRWAGLIYSPVGGEDKNDVDVFYCDECENERDPRLPVYCCSEGCPYIAEIKYVTSEVKRSLLGYNGEVELKSLISKMAGKVIGKYYLPPQETDGAVEQRIKIAMKLIVVSELRTQTCIEAFLWLQDTGLRMIPPRAGDHKLLCFNIQFALDRLDRIVFAYYGLQTKAEKENLQKIDGEISELDQDIKKLEALLVDKRARLQELQKRRGHVASKEIVGSSLIDKCLGEASELKWRLAGEGLFEK